MKAIPPFSFLLLVFISLSGTVSAQTTTPATMAAARQLLAEAKGMFDSGNFDQGAEQAEMAYLFFHNHPESDRKELADAAYQAGRGLYFQEKFMDARQRFEEAGNIWQLLNPEGSVDAGNAVHYVSRCFYQQGKIEEALAVCSRAYEIRQKLSPPVPCDLSESLRILGNINLKLGNYEIARQHYESALAEEKACSGEESTQTADILGNMAVSYLRLADYQKAITTEEKALMIRQKKLPPLHPDIARSCMTLGEVYQRLSRFDEAIFYYDKALEIYKKSDSRQGVNIAYAYSEIAQYFLTQKNYPAALEYIERENELMLQLRADTTSEYAYTCADFGRFYLEQKDYPKAIEWYQKMVDVYRKSFKNPNTQLGSLLTHLGKAKLANEDFEGALSAFRETKQIYHNILGADTYPEAKADFSIANTYRKWYLKLGQDSLLQKSRESYHRAVAGVKNQLPKEYAAVGQRKVVSEALVIFERAISAELLNLKNHPGDTDALEGVWQLSEGAHACLLLRATQEANARHFGGIPDSLLTRDSLVQAGIASLEKARQTQLERGLKLTDSLVLAINARIFTQKEEAVRLRSYFEKNYPDYYRLKYELQTSSLGETRGMLSPQQTLLEYFVGDFSIFVFVVQHDSSYVVELPLDFPLRDWVQDFHEGISGYHTATADQKTSARYEKTVRQYADTAQKLYEKLLAPIATALTPEIIVVPGDGLASLPFEALLSAAPKDLTNFNTYPFLLRKFTFQYAYSATMLHQMVARQHYQKPKDGLLAFAPFFEEDTASLSLRLQKDESVRRGFLPLPYSGEEVLRAKKRYGRASEILTGPEATKQKFIDRAANFSILHLATHGKANQRDGDFSFIAFAPAGEAPGNNLLSVAELYNLSLNADLVVLSACETGIGEEHRGEGMVSLARAFAFAGAKSIVASLWSVSDKSTMQIMDSFYAGIKAGDAKNIALANAKRSYLKQNPGLKAHPFFWAGLVGAGDMLPVKN